VFVRQPVIRRESCVSSENGLIIGGQKRAKSVSANFKQSDIFLLHGINPDNIHEAYEREKRFYSLISVDYSLNAPIRDDSNKVVAVAELRKIRGPDEIITDHLDDEDLIAEMMSYAEEFQGQYKISMVGKYVSLDAIELFTNPARIDALIRSHGIKTVTDIKLVTLYQYGVDILYFAAGKIEYAIPFSQDTDKNFVNGQIYNIDEFLEMLPLNES
jgi:hypothetical protein